MTHSLHHYVNIFDTYIPGLLINSEVIYILEAIKKKRFYIKIKKQLIFLNMRM